MKTSLLVANDSRDEVRNSDSWGTNVLLEAEVPASAVKRPGLTLTYDGTSPGQGVFIWPDSGEPTVVTVEDDELTFPFIIEIGDLIDDWYAMVENPPTPPGPDDDYWSPSPPDSRRYQAWSWAEVLAALLNSPAYWASQSMTFGSASTNCNCTTKLAATQKAAVKQALRYLRKSCPGYYYSQLRQFGATSYYSEIVIYYPYGRVFNDVGLFNLQDIYIQPGIDAVCSDVTPQYGSVLAGSVYMYAKTASTNQTGSPPTAPVCASASTVDLFDAISLVRRV